MLSSLWLTPFYYRTLIRFDNFLSIVDVTADLREWILSLWKRTLKNWMI